MRKLNCWEIMKCGREPGGSKVGDLGICPAASDEESTGINDGLRAGRICWAVAGTFCRGKIKGSRALTIASCVICEVYERVKKEETSEKFHLLATKRSYSTPRR